MLIFNFIYLNYFFIKFAYYRKIKDMIDLNVRLDSSLGEDDYGYLARQQKIVLPEEYKNILYFSKNNKEDYEKARQIALSLLQKEDAIEYAVASLVHRLYNQGYAYAEIAFTPYFHNKEGLKQRKILKAALRGLNDALKKCPGMDANFILYCHRDATYFFNAETVDLALEYKDERVVALGLEGNDKSHPMVSFEKLFAKAKKENYPVVVELGESYISNSSIAKAIEIGAKRIVAPYKFELDLSFVQTMVENGVYFEYRPSLDNILGKLNSLEELPLKAVWQYGYPAYISGCAYYIADAALKKEFARLNRRGFMREDVQRSLYNSINAAFVRNIRERNRIMKYSMDNFEHFYNKTI